MRDIEADLYIANTEIKKLRAELDAAVQDLNMIAKNYSKRCEVCANAERRCWFGLKDECQDWEWRGVKGENP